MHGRLPQEHRALRRGLAEVEAGVEHDLLGCEPDRFGPPRAVEQERGHVGDEIVVVRIGIGDARAQADVRRDDGRVVLGRDREIVGIGEARDVVADDRARRRTPASSTDARHVSTESGTSKRARERLDRRHDPVELLGLTDLRARARP